MLYTTRAVALHYHKYNDKSLIIKAYTQAHGLKTYFSRIQKGGKMGLSYFQPLTLIDIVAYNKENNNIQNLKEVSLAEPLHNLSGNIVKSSIAVFMAEVFIHSVKQEESEEGLYDFMANTIRTLNDADGNLSLFPHNYLLGLSKFLGFFPAPEDGESYRYFDLMSGQFDNVIPPHPHYTDGAETQMLADFIHWHLGGDKPFILDKPKRELLLMRLIEYYRVHIESFGTLKSNHVLKEVLG